MEDEKTSFEVTGNEIVITDPCYDLGTWCQKTITNAKKGKWTADIVRINMNEDPAGYVDFRNCSLTAWHTDSYEQIKKAKWVLSDAAIGVDSGQAGVFDKAHYQDKKVIDKEWKKKIKNSIIQDDDWYAMSCEVTLKSLTSFGFVPYGVVSSSGFGDGSYSLFTKEHKGKVIAVKIVFIPTTRQEATKYLA